MLPLGTQRSKPQTCSFCRAGAGAQLVVGHVQKVYGGEGAAVCCRMVANLNSYVLDFPPGCTAAQRSLLLGGLMHINYAYLEKTGACGLGEGELKCS